MKEFCNLLNNYIIIYYLLNNYEIIYYLLNNHKIIYYLLNNHEIIYCLLNNYIELVSFKSYFTFSLRLLIKNGIVDFGIVL